MGRRILAKLVSVTVLTGITTLGLAAPADALFVEEPQEGGPGPPNPVTVIRQEWDLTQVAAGALGGVVLVGVGMAAVAGLRRSTAPAATQPDHSGWARDYQDDSGHPAVPISGVPGRVEELPRAVSMR